MLQRTYTIALWHIFLKTLEHIDKTTSATVSGDNKNSAEMASSPPPSPLLHAHERTRSCFKWWTRWCCHTCTHKISSLHTLPELFLFSLLHTYILLKYTYIYIYIYIGKNKYIYVYICIHMNMYLATSRPIQIIYSMCFFQGVLGTSSVGCHQMSSESAILTALSSESMISITVDRHYPRQGLLLGFCLRHWVATLAIVSAWERAMVVVRMIYAWGLIPVVEDGWGPQYPATRQVLRTWWAQQLNLILITMIY